MMKIFKYILNKSIIGAPQIIKLHRHGLLVHSDFFNNEICMWYCVTEPDELVSQSFIINHTGDELDINSDYLATVIDKENKIVYHISCL